MPELQSIWSKIFRGKRKPIDKYHLSVVTTAAELEFGEILPLEIRFVLAFKPSRHETFRLLLGNGFGIGVRTVEKTPERILQAVDRLSRLTQHNTILPWLEKLLKNEEMPVFSEEELRLAEAEGINLYEEVKIILEQRFEFKKIVLIALQNQCVSEEVRALILEVNQDLYPYAIEFIVNRVTFDNAHTRTEVAQSIIKALLIIGPVAHLLEHVLTGIGKIFAATADDLMSEAAELFALRGSGFTWRQLFKRSRILIPVFILATIGAFQVEPLVQSGHLVLAGMVFGLSAVMLSLTTAIQSIRLYQRSYFALHKESKLKVKAGESTWGYALKQDFTNPARLGLFAGALASPFMAALIFSLLPHWTKNGWILALLGSTESVVAGIAIMSASRINKWFFRAKISRVLRKTVINAKAPTA